MERRHPSVGPVQVWGPSPHLRGLIQQPRGLPSLLARRVDVSDEREVPGSGSDAVPSLTQSHHTGESAGDPGGGGRRRGGLLRAGRQREDRREQDQPARPPERGR